MTHVLSKALPIPDARSFLAILLSLLALAQVSQGVMVDNPFPLEKLAAEADLIFKGEALASEPVQDEWFKPDSGYPVRETRFKIVSLIKGQVSDGEIRFRHLDLRGNSSDYDRGSGSNPQIYHFEPGRTYIVFAHQTPTGARQTRLRATGKSDQGVLRCLDNRPVTAKTLPEIFWSELLALRDSPLPDDVVYALQQLDRMSEGSESWRSSADFSRLEVLAAVHKLITRPEPKIAQAAIRIVGAGSPYLDDHTAPYWLGTVGVPNPGLAQMDPGTRNAGGALAWRELAAVANSTAAPETRALAIRALGLVKARELRQIMDPWLKSPEVPVRAAAVLLFTDFATPHEYTTGVFAGLAADPAPEVRKCTAYSIGFMQDPAIVPVLAKLLKDDDEAVRRAATESLHSFSPKIPTVAAVLKGNLKNTESQPLSLLALARENPAEHLEALARVIEENTTPTNSSGGQIPAFTAWKLLFTFLRNQPPADIRSGKWDRYLDALEKVGNYSSSEPRDIYAFYLQRELPKRAAKYRAAAKKKVTYDLDYYFDMADKSPETYQGN